MFKNLFPVLHSISNILAEEKFVVFVRALVFGSKPRPDSNPIHSECMVTPGMLDPYPQ